MDTPQKKTCSKCHVSKLLDEFYDVHRGKYGKAGHCKACKQRRDATRINMLKIIPEEKPCTKCKVIKSIQNFGRDIYTKDGHTTRCKPCIQAFKDAQVDVEKIVPEDKICLTCKIMKPIGEFDGNQYTRDGYTTRCKACTKIYNDARIDAPKVVREAKVCCKCGMMKTIDKFGRDKSTKDSHATRCKECKKLEWEIWRTANPKKARASSARWKAEHPEELAAYTLANAPRRSVQRKTRHAADPEKENAQNRATYALNKDKWRPTRRAYDQAHPDMMQEKNKRRRAQVAGSDVNDLTHAQWLEVQEVQGHRCYYCKKRCKGKLTQDHLTPLSKGGLHTLHNVIAVCMSCNSRKGPRAIPIPVQPMLLTLAPARKPKKKGA